MRSLRLPHGLIVALLAMALLSIACSDGGGNDMVLQDIDTIPTATPPDVLPDVLIVAESDVPISGASYAVQAGDTLLEIADRFGTTADAILNANDGVDSANLQVGQLLIIPGLDDGSSVPGATDDPVETDTPEPEDPTDTPEPIEDPTDTPEPIETEAPDPGCENGHVLEEGEFPANVAPIYDITVEELMAANPGIDPTTLQIGDCLILP